MNVHIVTAHPEVESFNFALTDAAIGAFRERGASVRQTRLYQEGFSLAPGREDFVAFPPDKPLRLLKAQREAEHYGGFVPQIADEQNNLLWCDLLVLQFPLWWGTYPAVLKGWIERVLSSGFAYGRATTLPARAVVLSATTGGADSEAEEREYRDRLDRMADDVFGYMGWKVYPPLVNHAPDRASDNGRRSLLEAHRARIFGLIDERIA